MKSRPCDDGSSGPGIGITRSGRRVTILLHSEGDPYIPDATACGVLRLWMLTTRLHSLRYEDEAGLHFDDGEAGLTAAARFDCRRMCASRERRGYEEYHGEATSPASLLGRTDLPQICYAASDILRFVRGVAGCLRGPNDCGSARWKTALCLMFSLGGARTDAAKPIVRTFGLGHL